MFEKPRVIVRSKNDFSGFKSDFELYHDINIILGDSGSGKTMLFSNMSNPDSETVALDKGGNRIPVFYVDNEESGEYQLETMKLRGIRKALIVSDDAKGFLKSDTLLNRIKECMGETILLFIGRDVTGMKDLKVACFSNALYLIEEDLNEINIKRVCDYVKWTGDISEKYGTISVCISECEDSSGEYLYLKNFFDVVIPSNGRMNIIKIVKRVMRENTGIKEFYIFVDMCSYGTSLYDLLEELKRYPDIEFCICEQLSYEYTVLEMMGKVNLISQDTDFCIGRNGNTFSFEKYVAEILSGVRYGNCGYFRKSGVPLIFRNRLYDCSSCSNDNVRKRCTRYKPTKGKSIKSLIVNSKEASTYVLCSRRGFELCSE